MEDSGIEDGGDQNGDNMKNSGSNSGRSSIGHSPTVPKISSLDQLIQILGDQNQRPPLSNKEEATSKLNLIPIERLPIPGVKEKQPLVQWDSDDSEEDIINFFPVSRKESRIHQEISDTFSIEEMSISGEEDEDEEDLHLIPPQTDFTNFSCCHCSPCTIV